LVGAQRTSLFCRYCSSCAATAAAATAASPERRHSPVSGDVTGSIVDDRSAARVSSAVVRRRPVPSRPQLDGMIPLSAAHGGARNGLAAALDDLEHITGLRAARQRLATSATHRELCVAAQVADWRRARDEEELRQFSSAFDPATGRTIFPTSPPPAAPPHNIMRSSCLTQLRVALSGRQELEAGGKILAGGRGRYHRLG
jgi:hypothetical protein